MLSQNKNYKKAQTGSTGQTDHVWGPGAGEKHRGHYVHQESIGSKLRSAVHSNTPLVSDNKNRYEESCSADNETNVRGKARNSSAGPFICKTKRVPSNLKN